MRSAKRVIMGVVSAIGNTPVVELDSRTCGKPGVRVLAKLEGNNPGGSIKDRAALYIIAGAEKSGRLSGKTILEATSGNTGIALAMIGATGAYRVKLCMTECVSLEKPRVLLAHHDFGTIVVILPDRGDRYLSTTLFRSIRAKCPP
jgi:S-sulfo-L-cysteine synthase (O-acetyl-L-serine-dependent)